MDVRGGWVVHKVYICQDMCLQYGCRIAETVSKGQGNTLAEVTSPTKDSQCAALEINNQSDKTVCFNGTG